MARAKSKSKSKPKSKPKARPKAKSGAKAKPAAKTRAKAPGLRSIRSVIYQVDDLALARTFYAAVLGKPPYFDEAYYVGFDVEGQELGLHPDISKLRPGAGGGVAYWRVDDLGASWQHVLSIGAEAVESPHDVGGGISTAIVSDPCGNLLGLIQTP